MDRAGTRRIRTAAKTSTVKITINVDRESLAVRAVADETGSPMCGALVDRLEQELKKVKRRLAA